MTPTQEATAVPLCVRPGVVHIHGTFRDHAIEARSRETRGDHDSGEPITMLLTSLTDLRGDKKCREIRVEIDVCDWCARVLEAGE
jgi:hypothetical protein